jgi:hypothetical protein
MQAKSGNEFHPELSRSGIKKILPPAETVIYKKEKPRHHRGISSH